ncbi:hypothetical protein LOAG_01449 [Loa loa]|uniref:Uncharacterized protein n=1 Tax=Loa loa TaxID=7209 RepID=A0A1S0UAW7_LOALO|nr:hypothetical protein LOAG_01449 [Loa loa]EFO27029.1 hypothetical protein LOAG_01449 [Loa loa]
MIDTKFLSHIYKEYKWTKEECKDKLLNKEKNIGLKITKMTWNAWSFRSELSHSSNNTRRGQAIGRNKQKASFQRVRLVTTDYYWMTIYYWEYDLCESTQQLTRLATTDKICSHPPQSPPFHEDQSDNIFVAT